MKILFAGPSLWDVPASAMAPLQLRAPARQGDILAAVCEGATAIGLVDGIFGNVPSVWHKEILYALEQGVPVLGAASMGALRAAECAAFGMVGIGEVYQRYASGALVRDDAVAQSHAPAELGWRPLSEALVNIEATLDRVLQSGLIDIDVDRRLRAGANELFFAERTFEEVVEKGGFSGEAGDSLLGLLLAHRVDLKRLDAWALVQAMMEPIRKPDITWKLERPPAWQKVHADAVQRLGQAGRAADLAAARDEASSA